MRSSEFTRLFEPFSLGRMHLRNRIVMPAMGTNYGDEQGYVTERMKDYYSRRAKGGAGLVIIENTYVDSPAGKSMLRQPAIDHDRYIPGLTSLAQAIQKHGAAAAIQLGHPGRIAPVRVTGVQPVAPSAIRAPGFEMPRELTADEIAALVSCFAKGAERARKAGFDGVELHAGHQYIIEQFLCPASNKRQDRYGVSLENRARLLVEILRSTRELVGDNYPVWCRLNGDEFGIEGSPNLKDMLKVALMARQAGADAIHVTSWPIGSYRFPPMAEPPGNIVYLAEAFKKALAIPVISVGRITPEVAIDVLEQGKADLVAMGKALIADPDLPNKLASGKRDDIIPCIGCICCHQTLRNFGEENGYLRCCVNPETGREREYTIRSAAKKKKVLIIGGGPAGMEAASVAALRGHDVTLCDRQDRLGGLLLAARLPPHKDGISLLLTYLTRRVENCGVKVLLDTEANFEFVRKMGPEAVILAAGSGAIVPAIPGINSARVAIASAALRGLKDIGDRVVIIGGGLVGCETAEYLAAQGKKVTIVEILDRLATGIAATVRRLLLQRLAAAHVTMLAGAKFERVDDKSVTVTTKEGTKLELEADTIVVAAGARSDRSLYDVIKSLVSEVYLAGDCEEPRTILDAIEEGSRVARRL